MNHVTIQTLRPDSPIQAPIFSDPQHLFVHILFEIKRFDTQRRWYIRTLFTSSQHYKTPNSTLVARFELSTLVLLAFVSHSSVARSLHLHSLLREPITHSNFVFSKRVLFIRLCVVNNQLVHRWQQAYFQYPGEGSVITSEYE